MFALAFTLSIKERKCQPGCFLTLALRRLIDGAKRDLEILRQTQIAAPDYGYIFWNA